jgi:hypothetical protein
VLITMETTRGGGNGNGACDSLYRCETPIAADLRLAMGGQEALGGRGAEQASYPPVIPWAGLGRQEAWHRTQLWAPRVRLAQESRGVLLVGMCQKYQAKIRAATPTHLSKNSPMWGGREWVGFPQVVAWSGKNLFLRQGNQSQGQGQGSSTPSQKRHF